MCYIASLDDEIGGTSVEDREQEITLSEDLWLLRMILVSKLNSRGGRTSSKVVIAGAA